MQANREGRHGRSRLIDVQEYKGRTNTRKARNFLRKMIPLNDKYSDCSRNDQVNVVVVKN